MPNKSKASRSNQLTPAQVKEIWPLCETEGLLGAIQHPDDGYINPSDITMGMAKLARDNWLACLERTLGG